MTTFRTIAGVTACTSCGQVIDGTGWRPKTGHIAAHNRADQLTARASRVRYIEALAYADALARLNASATREAS